MKKYPRLRVRHPPRTSAQPQRRSRNRPKIPAANKVQMARTPYLLLPVPNLPCKAAKAFIIVTSNRNMQIPATPGSIPLARVSSLLISFSSLITYAGKPADHLGSAGLGYFPSPASVRGRAGLCQSRARRLPALRCADTASYTSRSARGRSTERLYDHCGTARTAPERPCVHASAAHSIVQAEPAEPQTYILPSAALLKRSKKISKVSHFHSRISIRT